MKEGPFGGIKTISRKYENENFVHSDKNVNGGLFGLFQHPFSCKYQKIEVGTAEDECLADTC